MLTDELGRDIPFADHDAVIECGACDPDHGPAEDWPAWCDQDRWVPNQDPEYDEWLDRISAIMDGQDRDGPITDDDVITATGCAG
jgi:hypothetical protein